MQDHAGTGQAAFGAAIVTTHVGPPAPVLVLVLWSLHYLPTTHGSYPGHISPHSAPLADDLLHIESFSPHVGGRPSIHPSTHPPIHPDPRIRSRILLVRR